MATKTDKSENRVGVVQVQGSEAYREWFDEFAASLTVPGPTLVDIALKDLAAARGFRPMPKRMLRKTR